MLLCIFVIYIIISALTIMMKMIAIKKSNNNINSFSRQDGKLNVIATFFVNYFS